MSTEQPPPPETDQRPAQSNPDDHWDHVLKKLAPQGYQRSPAWQQEIIERVVKKLATQNAQKVSGKSGNGAPKELLARTIDLSALGVSPESVETFRLEEQRVAKTMKELPNLNVLTGGKEGLSISPEVLSTVEKQLADRSNQVHYYIRAIQMEQLLEQELEADLKTMRDEVGAAVKDEQFGQSKAASVRLRLERQKQIVKKRCEALTVKASEIGSDNTSVRLNIDDLRKEKMSHREQVTRMKVKAEKMDADIAFLTQQAHGALDQREKVRGKFLMAQRDMMQEREQKLAVIAELVTRANALDEDWAERQAQIADAEEQRRRESYGTGRKKREVYEGAEVRFGFLTAQTRGWESEFERLQAFTGMETKFDPREKQGQQVVQEITSRYAEKERANTSLLRYLNEQQAEVAALTEKHKEMQTRREDLHHLLGIVPSGYGGGLTPESLLSAAATEDSRSDGVEALLEDVCGHVHAASKSVFQGSRPDANSLSNVESKCTIKTVDKWLAALEKRLFEMLSTCQALCQPDDEGHAAVEKLPLVLSDWCQRDKGSKVPRVTVPEIHDALCLQAAQQRKGGELEDDDEEVGDDAKKEAEKNRSPFKRAPVNKAQERQRIIEWARKRQPGQNKLAAAQVQQIEQATKSATASGGAHIRASSSAPALQRGPSGATAGGLPAIGEARKPHSGRGPVAEPPAAFTAPRGTKMQGSGSATQPSLLPPQPASGAPPGGAPPPPPPGEASMGKRSGMKNRLRSSVSASTPTLSAAPKDLGTVIYLLGTQSNSMNARRFLEQGREQGRD